MAQCVGVKKDGVRCTIMVIGDPQYTRCGKHMETFNKVGPNQIRRDELKYTHKRMIDEIHRNFNPVRQPNYDADVYEFQARPRAADLRLEEIRYLTELHALEETITRETEANGNFNADRPFRQQAEERRRERQIALQQRRVVRWENAQQVRAPVHPYVAPAAAGGAGELRRLAEDRQNVHTAVVVQKVKETVQKVLRIPVPPEYQTDTLKTAGEIVLECGLTKQSAWQMMAKYCGDENIYDLGHGIYARVLNSVWQYIKASPNAVDLKKILKAEMQDNIGMCAQGNLSRLCNILSGYMEGVKLEIKSKNEIIGERLSVIMRIEDRDDRIAEGFRILEELAVPEEEQDIWMDPLIEV